jgi:putative transposase
MRNPFKYFNSSPEVIRIAVLMYVRYPLSLRNVEDLLAERGIDICHEIVRHWWNRFGPMFAAEIRKKRIHASRSFSNWRWHLDEVFVKINGELHYLRRAVDHEGEVLEVIATKRRNRKAAWNLLRRLNADRRECGRWVNNRAENSHQPFRRRERAMLRFRSMKTLQKFSTIHASIQNQFNQERHLVSREQYKQDRSAALADWRMLVA